MPASIVPSDLVRRAVWVPAGDHLVSLRYHPLLVLELFACSVLLTLWLAGITARGALERRRPRESVAPRPTGV